MLSDIAYANATINQLELARDTALKNAAAQVSMAEADLQLASVESGVEAARQNLALADARLERTVVMAPATGQILDIYVRPGEAVSSNRLLSLGNTDEMYVVAEVYETDVGLVDVGQQATITSRNGAFEGTLSGTVETISLFNLRTGQSDCGLAHQYWSKCGRHPGVVSVFLEPQPLAMASGAKAIFGYGGVGGFYRWILGYVSICRKYELKPLYAKLLYGLFAIDLS